MNKSAIMRGIAAAGCVLLALGLFGCSGGRYGEVVNNNDTAKEKVMLTFFGNKEDVGAKSVIESFIGSFMEQHENVYVSYEAIKGNDYFKTLRKRMNSDHLDDIIIVNHDIFLELHKAGQLASLQDLPSIQKIDNSLGFCDKEGNIYWVPTTVSAFGLYCNEDLLKQHNQKIPRNLQEWREVNDYFISKGITPVIANNDISLKTMAIGVSFYGGYKDGSITKLYADLNSGEQSLGRALTPGFKLVEEFIRKGYVDKDKALLTEKTRDDINDFLKGKSPFMLTGAWAANRVKNKKPAFTFSVQPLPVFEDSSILVVNADTRLAVNGKSKHVKQAKEFVDSFCSADNLERFCQEQASFNPSPGGKSAKVTEIASLHAAYQAKQYAVGSDDRLLLPIWELTRKAVVAMLKGADAAQAMQDMDKAAAEYRKQQLVK